MKINHTARLKFNIACFLLCLLVEIKVHVEFSLEKKSKANKRNWFFFVSVCSMGSCVPATSNKFVLIVCLGDFVVERSKNRKKDWSKKERRQIGGRNENWSKQMKRRKDSLEKEKREEINKNWRRKKKKKRKRMKKRSIV